MGGALETEAFFGPRIGSFIIGSVRPPICPSVHQSVCKVFILPALGFLSFLHEFRVYIEWKRAIFETKMLGQKWAENEFLALLATKNHRILLNLHNKFDLF